MSDSDPSPWKSVEDPGWERTVDAWPWRSIGGGDWAKSGACPHCDATITILKQGSIYAYITEPHPPDLGLLLSANHGPIILQASGSRMFARCNCGEDHKKRPPALKYGCGRAGYIDGPPSND